VGVIEAVTPSEELRAFLLRFYSAWEACDFESMAEMPHLARRGPGPPFVRIGPDDEEMRTRRKLRPVLQ
jgi:hypothetical protein